MLHRESRRIGCIFVLELKANRCRGVSSIGWVRGETQAKGLCLRMKRNRFRVTSLYENYATVCRVRVNMGDKCAVPGEMVHRTTRERSWRFNGSIARGRCCQRGREEIEFFQQVGIEDGRRNGFR